MSTVIKVEKLSKAYQIGQIGTGTISRDLERWWITKVMRKEDPFLKLGETNDRSVKGKTDVVWSLKDINFELKQGDVIGIIGKNGAGKSTLLKLLTRVTSPTAGKIKVKGRVASLLEVGTGFHPELTGRENIYLNGSILGMRNKEITRKLDEIIEFSGVERYIDTPVKRYSSGMYVRLAFAVAAHLESEILIVDEVLAVGDAEFQNKCLGKMQDVSRNQGRTVLFVSHTMSSIIKLCNRGVFLKNGYVGLDGNVRDAVSLYSNENLNDSATYNDEAVKEIIAKYNDGLLEITIIYEHTSVLEAPNLGFVISDLNGHPIYGTNTKTSYPKTLSLSRRSGKITVTVKEPKLLDGIYNLSIWFGNQREDFFHRKDCVSFEVLSRSGQPQLPAITVGHAIPQCDWSFSQV